LIILQVTGIALLALGIWMKVQLYIYMELTTTYYAEAPYILIGIGAAIVVVGSLGCCCTVKGHTVLLYMVRIIAQCIQAKPGHPCSHLGHCRDFSQVYTR
jgi:hypothetical protein